MNRTAIQSRLREIVGKMPLSRFAKESGIPLSTLSRAYNGAEILNLEHMHKICVRFGVPLTWLLAEDDGELSELPILGFASCGLAQGWFVEENHPRTALVHACFANSDCFGVLAKGDSMVPAGIESGDLCIIDSSKPVECGKPVMVRADWFYKRQKHAHGNHQNFRIRKRSGVFPQRLVFGTGRIASDFFYRRTSEIRNHVHCARDPSCQSPVGTKQANRFGVDSVRQRSARAVFRGSETCFYGFGVGKIHLDSGLSVSKSPEIG